MSRETARALLVEANASTDNLVPAPDRKGGVGGPYVYTAPIADIVRRRPWAVRNVARLRGDTTPDTSHIKVMLGVKPRKRGEGYQDRMDYDVAVWLCHRLGYDPVDWDL
jgi:hypothetical protein